MCIPSQTQEKSLYPKLLDLLRPWSPPNAAHLLGWHVEGPFLEMSKRGAHSPPLIIPASEGFKTFESIYGAENLAEAEEWFASVESEHDNAGVRIITAAPEVEGVMEAVNEASKRGICFNIGHRYARVENNDTMLPLIRIVWLRRMLQLQQYGTELDASRISSMQCHNFTIAIRLSSVCSALLLTCLRLQLSCHSLLLSTVLSRPRYRHFQSPRSLSLLPLIIYQKLSMRLRHPLRHRCFLQNKLTRRVAFRQPSLS